MISSRPCGIPKGIVISSKQHHLNYYIQKKKLGTEMRSANHRGHIVCIWGHTFRFIPLHCTPHDYDYWTISD